MEGREHKEQPASTDEATTTISGAGRYYGCIFCKRGFQTSQALGGHMNIHRQERCRIRPAAKPMSTRVAGREVYHPYSYLRHPRHAPAPMCERWAARVVYTPGNSEFFEKLPRPRERAAAAEEAKRKVDEGKEDLDLELRLGYAW